VILLFLCLVTSDGKIALGNLDSQIAGFENAGHFEEEIPLLLLRGQILGHPADYGRALMVANELVKKKSPRGFLLRAQARTTLHQFKGALADLSQAEKLKFDVSEARAAIWEAIGDEERALPIREAAVRARPDISALGALAALKGRLGLVDEAHALFAAARESYRDVSPFPVAWTEFQEGLIDERQGHAAAARDRFQSAHDRLPEYAPAIGHLAGALAATGEKPKALQLLRPLAEAMDDPEYATQYLSLSPDEKLKSRATARYQELLAQFPEAYADHAARFFLGSPKAIELAKKNLANRHTDDAHQLLIEALLGANQNANACKAADEALARRRGATLKLVAARAYLACGQKARADAILTPPKSSPPK
jgi:tetratricopeptide (TPR) repeat protein